ncbi:MAG: AAA family ATPase, partial [Oscillospiraceae bacterium]|nr:AAA family ATPase [Oscillospiraceae bacterium]
MIIRKLRASFGALDKSELTLNGGLNIIEAPNESGKSTWCAFIKVMLYGLNTSDRDRNGYISDKTHYRPWSGGPMEGEMDVSLDGRILTLRRTGTGSSPMRRFSAFYADTGDETQISGTDIGESLTGVSERVFERTAFIRQAGIKVDNAYELEKKIASIVASGDEQTSGTEADKNLKDWQNALRHNKTGLLPRLEEEKQKAEDKYDAISRGFESLSDARSEVERLEKVREQLKDDLKKHEIFEVRDEAKRVLDAKKALSDAENRLKDAKAEAEAFREATPERRDEIKAAAAALAAVAPVYVSARDEHERALLEAEKARIAESESVFSGMSVKEAEELAERAEKLEKDAADSEERARKAAGSYKRTVITLAAVTAFLLIAAIVLMLAAPGASPLFFIPAAAVLIALIIFAVLKKPKREENAGAEIAEILEKYGVPDSSALSLRAKEYRDLVSARENAEAALRTAETARENAEKLAAEGQTKLDMTVAAA